MLLLVVGDIHIPERTCRIPKKFEELLVPGKIQHVLCTGNLTCKDSVEFLRNLAGDVHVVRGECDPTTALWPEEKMIQIGDFRIALTHGHQILPFDDLESLKTLQRCLDADVVISGHTHKLVCHEEDNVLFLNPGSLTGADTVANNLKPVPSFMLLDINSPNIVIYIYKLIDGKVDVTRKEFKKQQSMLNEINEEMKVTNEESEDISQLAEDGEILNNKEPLIYAEE